jgi:HD-GYP domain-containing protein (c-di-GMP phosphodiesterase class II)
MADLARRYSRVMPDALRDAERVRAAEVIAALSLATDLGIAVPLEHGLQSTLFAMRLADRLGVDAQTASQTYHACLLFYVGCTANADVAAEIFGTDDALTRYAAARRFGSKPEMMGGFLRAVAPPGGAPLTRARQLAHGLPKVASVYQDHLAAFCEVATMLTDRLGVPSAVGALFSSVAERWDGRGQPGRMRGDAIPLPVRIVHVARDAAFQLMLGGQEFATRVVRRRAGHAFDPDVAAVLVEHPAEVLALDSASSVWDETLAIEPEPRLMLRGESIDDALAAMGDFSDLVSPSLTGHSAGVASLASAAARLRGFPAEDIATLRRAALVHDVGRVAVPARIWQQPGPLTTDDWEKVRLHPYHTERVLVRSPFLAALAPLASAHHERCDGSGYYRGTTGAGLSPLARTLSAADAYHTKTEPRPHRAQLDPEQAAQWLGEAAHAGRLDADAVAAVLAAAGQRVPRIARPAGLTEREAEVVGLLARGQQTKQIAHALGISIKTADRHIQNAYTKIGVSTRAAAALFAMRHGIVAWGELPITRAGHRS